MAAPGAITELVFNPSWYIPSSIARKEILPRDARNPGYIASQGIRVSYSADRVRLSQPPGPKNPLGRVKFNTPNQYGVYLHDTPSKHLMTQSERAFSHGWGKKDWLENDPDYDCLRGEPRFIAMMAGLK